MLVISNRPHALWSSNFEITPMITLWIVLHCTIAIHHNVVVIKVIKFCQSKQYCSLQSAPTSSSSVNIVISYRTKKISTWPEMKDSLTLKYNLHSARSLPDFDSFSSRIEQPSWTAWLNQQHPPFSPGNLYFPIRRPLKEEWYHVKRVIFLLMHVNSASPD